MQSIRFLRETALDEERDGETTQYRVSFKNPLKSRLVWLISAASLYGRKKPATKHTDSVISCHPPPRTSQNSNNLSAALHFVLGNIYEFIRVIRNELLEAQMFAIDLVLETFRRLELRQ